MELFIDFLWPEELSVLQITESILFIIILVFHIQYTLETKVSYINAMSSKRVRDLIDFAFEHVLHALNDITRS
jgi:hypothetical protein